MRITDHEKRISLSGHHTKEKQLKVVPPSTIDLMVKLYGNGHGTREIADRLGVCESTTRARLKQRGCNFRRHAGRISDDQRGVMEAMRRQGKTYQEIAQALNICKATVFNHIGGSS